MKKKITPNNLVLYQTKSGALQLRGDFSKETMWATQAQIASAFDVDVRTVNEHIGNIYKTGELIEKATIRNFRIVRTEGKRMVERNVQHYNLDTILSVGYRVNSKKATVFRQWATKTLRSHIVDGFTINRSRIIKNYESFLKVVEEVKLLLPEGGEVDAQTALELVKMFADTWISIDAYDTNTFPKSSASKKQVRVTADELISVLREFRTELQKDNQENELFGAERQTGSVAGIVGNVLQSFGGKDVYPTLEEKAAHLLYFMIKNHPYHDGNKRHGAFSFIWFLKRAGLLRTEKMTPTALTALTLFIAESDPTHKERVVGLVVTLLKK